MALTPKDVQHVALLSRLELTPAEVDRYTSELAKIFTHVDTLAALDLADVPPTAHPLPMVDVFREDVVIPSLTTPQAVANAPEREGALFKVPQIV